MAKGARKLSELVSKLDVIIEVRDSRAPSSTSSPLIKSLSKYTQQKPVIHVLSRKDLADPEKLQLWLNGLKHTYSADLRKREGLANIRRAVMDFKPKHREVRLAVVGIPNVGKSLLLNLLAGKSSASVGNIPGITKSVSWYRNDGMLIVDSPGILDPHAEAGAHMILSWLGCAKAEVVGGWENAALSLIRFLTERSMTELIPVKLETETEGDDVPALTEILERIGRRYGCLISGGRVDTELAGRKFIEAFSSGKLGRFCLEVPKGEKAVDFAQRAFNFAERCSAAVKTIYAGE